eukprot:CAMPEP_0168567638 /NCGR_PEP_ID=MMETSP0413-20121227/15117_1 /TAXON_ID=136452 /ORGANISM="Filamoeba nolandi, Strain NC-AS-23-1" /LENGTH=233 /DNA_ID=CAMNT_0008599853 /DNA_START=44 /DNA_END=741 /DNA_ORIENTATION=+
MSSKTLRKLMKSKVHRERGQPSARKHLGLLEKRKDYRVRATKYKQNQEVIKKLREKAYFRNPDEYYTRMKKIVERKDRQDEDQNELPEAEKKLLESQSLTYLLMKQVEEKKRIEKLQQNLQLVSKKPVNNHIVFVDSTEEMKEFDPVAYFDTTPEGLERTYNRPKLEVLKNENLIVGTNIDTMDEDSVLESIEEQRRAQYQELSKRIKRHKAIQRVVKAAELKKNLQDKTRKA